MGHCGMRTIYLLAIDANSRCLHSKPSLMQFCGVLPVLCSKHQLADSWPQNLEASTSKHRQLPILQDLLTFQRSGAGLLVPEPCTYKD
eukprot:1155099-Pelagomonas_calceolata.AAC.9